jgi:DNA-binding GntR family transcriptional regulator
MQDEAPTTRSLTRAESIRQLLADDIVRGRLPPGLPLDEADIARKFGVSRTPVREAIRQLEATGLAEARPRRGAVVAAMTRERLDEMFFMMLELEALCAREASTHMTQDELEALSSLHDVGNGIAETADAVAYGQHNLAFHDLIYAGSHNAYLTEMTLGVRKRLAPFRQAQFDGPGRLLGSHREHGVIVAAILSGDADGASSAMRAHIGVVRDAYVTLMPLYGIADAKR